MPIEFIAEVEGLKGLKTASAAVQAAVVKELEKALFVAGKQIEREAKESILNGEKTGRLYKRDKGVTHRASAPGEAPASDTGRLINSINTYVDRSDTSATVVAGRGTVNYAAALEFGTQKVAPRPFMAPALEKSKPFIRDRLAKAVSDGIRKGAS
jgi:HK97 gp10 family phage protein